MDYSDMLRQSLPYTQTIFSSVLVVSCPGDDATLAICSELGVEWIQTDKWFASGARLNKAGALNEGLIRVLSSTPGSWVLSLDADIILPSGLRLETFTLDKQCLYSVRRRFCPDENLWKSYASGAIAKLDFPLEKYDIKNGKVWREQPTSNPAGLCGYFQLWNPQTTGIHRLPDSPSASHYDVEFALKFSEENRFFLDPFEVIHLAACRT